LQLKAYLFFKIFLPTQPQVKTISYQWLMVNLLRKIRYYLSFF
jgi:hypothetical protein